jgi:hypothetical protein
VSAEPDVAKASPAFESWAYRAAPVVHRGIGGTNVWIEPRHTVVEPAHVVNEECLGLWRACTRVEHSDPWRGARALASRGSGCARAWTECRGLEACPQRRGETRELATTSGWVAFGRPPQLRLLRPMLCMSRMPIRFAALL